MSGEISVILVDLTGPLNNVQKNLILRMAQQPRCQLKGVTLMLKVITLQGGWGFYEMMLNVTEATEVMCSRGPKPLVMN